MSVNFVHLSVHSEFSLLDGAIRLKKLIEACQEKGFKSVALTDNGVMYGAIDFYLAAKSAGVKPIIGCELYLVSDMLEKKRGFSRLICLCKNYEGYTALSKIVSKSHTEGFYYRPRVDLACLSELASNLIVISPGGSGPIATALKENESQEAHQWAASLKEVFKSDFYLGIEALGGSYEDVIIKESQRISESLSIPLVATNDVYYLRPEDAKLQQVLNCIRNGQIVDSEDWEGMQHNERSFKSTSEMQVLFQKYPEALVNTEVIANACHVEFDMEQVMLPHFECPDGLSDEDYLEQLVWEGIRRKYSEITKEIKDRVSFELDTIKKMQYPIYFLIIYDFLKVCYEKGIPVGPGRGSAAGSIIAYALDITKIDPLKYQLLFERFLNPERVSMPDIDLDFCIKRRGEVIEYLVQKYGEAHVAQIATFGTMAARAVVRDVGRVLDVPLSEVDRLAKLIPSAPGHYTPIEEAIETVSDLKQAYEKSAQVKQLLDIGMALEGFARHSSTHAAGVVISRAPLSSVVPLMQKDGQVATQYTMTVLEKLGLLKMDILGLRNLTVLEEAVRVIEQNHGVVLDLDHLPLEDAKTYEILCLGQTAGVFQLESTGMRQLIKDLKPSTFEDIIALLALYRPGPLGSGMVSDFVSNKSGKTEVKYDLPELEPILKDTYGMILYQEQVMQIASVVGGFTLAQADMLRRAMGKKKKEEMDRLKEDFLNGAAHKGINVQKAKKIFELCYKFAEYGFNKSHSAAYAMISYQTAYLKANYPVEYMSALLSTVMGNGDKVSFYVQECKKLAVPVYGPDVNASVLGFSIDSGAIRFGLGAVKNVGEGAILSIVEAREKGGKFESLFDFCSRVDLRLTNKRVIESLIKCGAFDDISKDRALLLSQCETSLEQAQNHLKQQETGQVGLFSVQESFSNALDDSYTPLTELQKLKYEKSVLGLYFSGHPLDQISEFMDKMPLNSSTVQELKNIDEEPMVKLAGIVTQTRKIITRTKKEMVSAVLEDRVGTIPIVLFQGKDFETVAPKIQDDNIVVVSGRLRLSNEELSLSCNSIDLINDSLAPKQLHVDLDIEENLGLFEEVKKICSKNRGPMPIYLHINGTVIKVHKKYWIEPDSKPLLESLLGESRVWEA